jgi:hypothetical protein
MQERTENVAPMEERITTASEKNNYQNDYY